MASRKPDRTPLIRFLKVQEQWETPILYELKRAASDIDRELRKLAGKPGVGAEMRRVQYLEAKKQILARTEPIWEKIGSTVEASRAKAAAAAIETTIPRAAILANVPHMTKKLLDTYQRSAIQSAQSNIAANIARLQGGSYVPLSQRVYKTQALANGYVDKMIQSALARGSSASELATMAKQFISPDVKGGISYAATRLGRTEINNAFHATSVAEAIRNPYIIGMEWHLSESHPGEDECNDYDGEVFDPADVPRKPHPNCLCYTTAVTPDPDDFVAGLFELEE